MPGQIYDAFLAGLAQGTLDFDDLDVPAALKVCLVDGYVFDATDANYAAISADESSGANYSAGGKALANVVVSGTNPIKLTADPTEWADVVVDATGAIVYHVPTGALIAYFADGFPLTSSGATLRLTWDPTNGVVGLAG